MERERNKEDLLDGFGKEIASIVFPVTVCMAATVYLVRELGPPGPNDEDVVSIATAYYDERPGDSDKVKLEGSLMNALVFVLVIGAMTFVLAGLFWLKCYKLIYGYMGFSGFSIFFVLGGTLFLELFQAWNFSLDIVSFLFLLYNFSVVGLLALFFMPMPTLLKQSYVVFTGIVTAYWFTKIPEWTTWIVLIAMALYDICAVLLPGGPLRLLVELAQERDEPLPALVYESRSRRFDDIDPALLVSGSGQEPRHNLGRESNNVPTSGNLIQEGYVGSTSNGVEQVPEQSELSTENEHVADNIESRPTGDNRAPLPASSPPELHSMEQTPLRRHWNQEHNEDDELALPDSIKLGLGDFIFYSLLVGRAAMYDMLTVFACYLAITMGLGATLFCLALYRRALPALPFSIALGVLFYFLSRGLLEHLIVSLSSNLLFV